jgi:hypothetical protein
MNSAPLILKSPRKSVMMIAGWGEDSANRSKAVVWLERLSKATCRRHAPAAQTMIPDDQFRDPRSRSADPAAPGPRPPAASLPATTAAPVWIQ